MGKCLYNKLKLSLSQLYSLRSRVTSIFPLHILSVQISQVLRLFVLNKLSPLICLIGLW